GLLLEPAAEVGQFFGGEALAAGVLSERGEVFHEARPWGGVFHLQVLIVNDEAAFRLAERRAAATGRDQDRVVAGQQRFLEAAERLIALAREMQRAAAAV